MSIPASIDKISCGTSRLANRCKKTLFALLLCAPFGLAQAVVIPDDPSQSIVYWKPHIVSSQQDPKVAQVEEIFEVLLRTWDGARIAPGVHVVKSSTGPWAASLADGNILLSMEALQTCLSFGPARAQHLLAFVLAHELAHQRVDDLWHQKFFRLIGNQSPDTQRKLLRGIDTQWINDVEQKEAQADHDAIVMMSSVGFDPYQVLDKTDFFTTWVEQLWQGSCAGIQKDHPAHSACLQAQTRRLRAQTQLETIATQTTIYDLALQSFVAGDFDSARHLLKVYGRELPSRAVYTSLGLSYLAEALQIKHQAGVLQASKSLAFFYPVVLDTEPTAAPIATPGDKRGSSPSQQLRQVRQLLQQASQYFDKAIKLEPQNRRSYLFLALSYLAANNTFMTRGILQGQYEPNFGPDPAMQMVLAMTSAQEGQLNKAITTLQKLSALDAPNNPLPPNLIRYATTHNLALCYRQQGKHRQAKAAWQSLAKQARKSGNSILFRLAVAQLSEPQHKRNHLQQFPQILSLRPGDAWQAASQKLAPAHYLQSEFWIEGERRVIYRLPEQGARFVVNEQQKIVSLWQQSVPNARIGRLTVGDNANRVEKVLGTPDREMFFTHGTYLAYDRYGMGIHIVNNQIAGWFLYDKIKS